MKHEDQIGQFNPIFIIFLERNSFIAMEVLDWLFLTGTNGKV